MDSDRQRHHEALGQRHGTEPVSVASARRPATPDQGPLLQSLLHRLVGAEWVTAPVSATLLLLHPTSLSWPAALIGASPSLARLALDGRLWRRSPFDLPIGLLVVGGLLGYMVTLDAASAGIRLAGLAAMLIIFAWLREVMPPSGRADGARWWLLGALLIATAAMVHVAQPFLRLDRVPPLGWLAQLLEPWGLYRLLVADAGALQRFRWYASGSGALAAVGLCFTVGLALVERRRWLLAGLAAASVLFAAVLLVADNRGSMVAAALTLGVVVVWWRPNLLLVATLVVFGTLDAIALGMVQRGLNLRTVVERLEFWQNGLLLATETPWSGVGLGAKSVELVYRAAFQPTYPPFSHTHSIYIQGLLEQGILGLVGLVWLVVVVVRLGARAGQSADNVQRGTGLAAAAGALALQAAGQTEIVALTTIGGALLAALLGLLAGVTDGAGYVPTWAPLKPPVWLRLPGSVRVSPPIVAIAGVAILIAGLLVSGLIWPFVASPFLNLGTTQLYRATLQSGVGRDARTALLADADYWLNVAQTVDQSASAPWRNRALAAAAAGDRDSAHELADTALSHTDPHDTSALFGVGRAYAAIEDWDQTIAIWERARAGPQLLRLGGRLAGSDDAATVEAGLHALTAAARLGAPGRLAQADIVEAALRRGVPLDAALARLDPLLEDDATRYQTQLQIARELARAGQIDRAETALAQAARIGSDPQLPLIQGMLLLASSRPDDADDAEFALRGAASGIRSAALPVPDGDDPRYWLAVAQVALGQRAEAVATAQAGLRELTEDQATLRVPYRRLLGENLVALGRAAEAIPVYEAGLRIAPGDTSLRDGLARARQAAGR